MNAVSREQRLIDPRIAGKVLIGFDRMASMLETLSDPNGSHPPYDVEKVGENGFVIRLAVAGYSPGEIGIETANGVLEVKGSKAHDKDDSKRVFLHRGIALRSFRHAFRLADYVEVTSASMENGMLVIELERQVPEALKPRRIEITAGTARAETAAAPAAE